MCVQNAREELATLLERGGLIHMWDGIICEASRFDLKAVCVRVDFQVLVLEGHRLALVENDRTLAKPPRIPAQEILHRNVEDIARMHRMGREATREGGSFLCGSKGLGHLNGLIRLARRGLKPTHTIGIVARNGNLVREFHTQHVVRIYAEGLALGLTWDDVEHAVCAAE